MGLLYQPLEDGVGEGEVGCDEPSIVVEDEAKGKWPGTRIREVLLQAPDSPSWVLQRPWSVGEVSEFEGGELGPEALLSPGRRAPERANVAQRSQGPVMWIVGVLVLRVGECEGEDVLPYLCRDGPDTGQ